MYIWPKLHYPENLCSRNYTCQNVHLAEITFPRELIFQNLHLPECTFGQNYIFPKPYFPGFTLARMYIWPKLHFPENYYVFEEMTSLFISKFDLLHFVFHLYFTNFFLQIVLFRVSNRTWGHMTEISSFALITIFFEEELTNEILAKRKRSFLHVYVKPFEIRYVILSR